MKESKLSPSSFHSSAPDLCTPSHARVDTTYTKAIHQQVCADGHRLTRYAVSRIEDRDRDRGSGSRIGIEDRDRGSGSGRDRGSGWARDRGGMGSPSKNPCWTASTAPGSSLAFGGIVTASFFLGSALDPRMARGCRDRGSGRPAELNACRK